MYKYFDELMKLNFYERTTLEWYSRNILKELSLVEFRKIEETILIDINKDSRANSSFWGGISVLIALFVGTYAILVALSSNLDGDQSQNIFILMMLIGVLFLIFAILYLESILNKKKNKLHDLIRLLIYLKENE